jgi:hypothetical protein
VIVTGDVNEEVREFWGCGGKFANAWALDWLRDCSEGVQRRLAVPQGPRLILQRWVLLERRWLLMMW